MPYHGYNGEELEDPKMDELRRGEREPETMTTRGSPLDDMEPEDVAVVRATGATGIETEGGPVGPGWRLFVDRRTATTAPPGAIVVATGRDGTLIVGELAQDAGGGWLVTTGAGCEPIARDGVLGTVVEAHPPMIPGSELRVRREPALAPREATPAADDPPAPLAPTEAKTMLHPP